MQVIQLAITFVSTLTHKVLRNENTANKNGTVQQTMR